MPKISVSQCEQSINLNASLSGGQSEEVFVELNQNITNITFNLNDYHSDGSWMIPRDLIVEISAPNGNCISGEGFNIPPLENCITIDWPSSWGEGNGAQNFDGNHSHSIAIPDNHLYGSGIWHFLIKNGRENGNNNEAHYNLEIILENIEGCTNELAENYNEFAICDDGNCLIPSSNICEVEVNFTWVLDSDWCESYCKIFNSNGSLVAGYFSACQNQGCAACDIDDLYTWFGGDVDAILENNIYTITQDISLPEGEYFIELHDGYGNGWSDGPSGGINAFTISGNINYSIDFLNGFTTTGYFNLSCEPGEGCTDITACNYDSNSIIDDGSCLYFDDCGICDGSGIPEGDCDCLGNVLDAVGECGGNCMTDTNGDGICDDCPGSIDECGICNGPGAIYGCGCEEIPDGDCDCEGNQEDALGECGGDCESDMNNNGVCDDEEVLGCNDSSACNYDELATTNDGSCEYCSCITEEDYSLTIEAFPAVAAEGTTYRFYVNMVNDDDHMSAVFGHDQLPMSINTPEGAFNTPINSSWNASGINPNFFQFFPDLIDDSYATIGLDVPALMYGMVGAENPNLVENVSQPITNYFMTPLATSMNINTVYGASYFVTNGAANGLPDEFGRVLIMQVTTVGDIFGLINYQIFPHGVGADEIIKTVEFSGAGTFGAGGGEELCGCTDPTACNFSLTAIYDDNSCEYFDACGICDGPGAVYDCGCFDIPIGACDCEGNVEDALGECGGDCLVDADADGVCDDEDPCVGDFDECGVCNGPGAIYECGCEEMPEGDCDCEGNQEDALGECGGDCEEDADFDGVCDDEDDCVGAYDECGVCNGPGAIYECGCEEMPEGDCDCEGNVEDALGECGGDCEEDEDSDGICDDEDPCVGEYDECGVCNGPGAVYECGCEQMPEGDCDCEGNVEDALGECGGDCEEDADFDGVCDDVDDCVGAYDECGVCNGPGAIYECGCVDIPEGDCDCEGNQEDALGECGGDCEEDLDSDGVCDDVDECVGEYDECGVCNGPGAIYECGCEDIPEGDCDCEGNQEDALGECGGDCEEDLDSDGVCDDEDECVGDFDECGVCNGPGAIYECGCEEMPEGDCDCEGNQEDALGECGGDCGEDLDSDGICDDVDDCVGEYDECGVCNGPGAIYECGCEEMPEGDCDCEGNVEDALGECGGDCAEDADFDGVCDNEDDCVGAYDECGVCNGPGAIYECGCEEMTEGDCDCEGNQEDALGECGGDCEEDTDSDGICDDVDDCVGEYDECGVCNGPGAIYECGCEEMPEGDCDCEGNQEDALGECGGDCEEDLDSDGICDDEDECVGEYDECGVCNGTGAIYECGCEEIPEGDCDCEGNQEDALGDCGGDCEEDDDADGICDDQDECVGEYDECGVCNGPGAIYECGCEEMPEGNCDCAGNVLDVIGVCGGDCEYDFDEDGVCDTEEIFGCTDELACNYDAIATEENGTCSYDCYGCMEPEACNFDPEATMDGGGCVMPGDPCDDGLAFTEGDFLQGDCSCNGYGCTDPEACNFVDGAIPDNSLCNYVVTYSITGALSSYHDMIVEYSYPNTNGSTYEWIVTFGDVTHGEGTSEVEVVWWGAAQGQLCVVETNEYGCSGDTACIIVSIINSVEEQEGASMILYPNPTRDLLNVVLEGSNEMRIYDLAGREVERVLVVNQTTIDITNLSAGTYLIKAVTERGTITSTFVVN